MAKIMISVPDKFLLEIDEVACAEHRTRSELIREALRQYTQTSKGYTKPADDPVVREAVAQLRSVRWKGKFDSTKIVRKMRDSRCAK
jgi:metal-responsive CopG/Arc/MetJ family transcriptional regulator